MSAHLETLETIYRTLWRENRLEDALADLPADFEWLVPELPGGDRREGPEAVTDFFRDFIDQCQARSGRGIRADVAAALVADAEYVRAHI